MYEGNSCTLKVSCNMWVEGDRILPLYETVLRCIFSCFETVFLVLLVSLHTLHFISMLCISMHIMIYATYCQISVLNVTKVQCIYLLRETYFYVLCIHCRTFVEMRAHAHACVCVGGGGRGIEILMDLNQQVLFSK
jgi:hypothetical protein